MLFFLSRVKMTIRSHGWGGNEEKKHETKKIRMKYTARTGGVCLAPKYWKSQLVDDRVEYSHACFDRHS